MPYHHLSTLVNVLKTIIVIPWGVPSKDEHQMPLIFKKKTFMTNWSFSKSNLVPELI